MNMISAAKYAKAAKKLDAVRGFREAGSGVVGALTNKEGYVAPAGAHLFIACSSDRGLCGALHTNLCKGIVQLSKEHDDFKIVCIGEKSKIALKAQKEYFLITCAEISRNPPTFAEASEIANAIIESGYEWKNATIVYNYHKSAMTQELKEHPAASIEGLTGADGFSLYDSVDESVVEDYSTYALAASIYGCLAENYTSEQSARMISMDGATKNAGDMIERMGLQYNRMRQAVITTELCEIIAGMAAL